MVITEKPPCKILLSSQEDNILSKNLVLPLPKTPKPQKVFKPLLVLPRASPLPRMTPSSCTEMDQNNKSKKELKSLKDKLKLPNQTMIEKSLNKDLPNSKVVSELLRLEVDPKLRSEKSRTELLMPFALPRPLLLKVLFQEEEQLFFMLHSNLTNLLNHLKTLLKGKLLVLESFKTPLEFHWPQFVKMQDSKDLSLPLNCWKKEITKKDSTPPTELTLI